MLGNKQKAIIHVAKGKVGMSEEEYRAMLEGFGVGSCSELNYKGFEAVMKHFERLGFVSDRAFRKPVESKKRLMSKVEAMRKDLRITEAYLDGMSARMFKNRDGVAIERWRWLSAGQMHKLVAALVYHQKRVVNRDR